MQNVFWKTWDWRGGPSILTFCRLGCISMQTRFCLGAGKKNSWELCLRSVLFDFEKSGESFFVENLLFHQHLQWRRLKWLRTCQLNWRTWVLWTPVANSDLTLFCCTGLPLACTRWVRLTSSSLCCPLSKQQRCQLTLATSTIFSHLGKNFRNARNRTRGCWVRKRERYHCAMLPPMIWHFPLASEQHQ